MNKRAPETTPAGSAAKSRAPWVSPAVRRLATSEAEFNPSGPNIDSEGFIS
jgi:hypothetical protein